MALHLRDIFVLFLNIFSTATIAHDKNVNKSYSTLALKRFSFDAAQLRRNGTILFSSTGCKLQAVGSNWGRHYLCKYLPAQQPCYFISVGISRDYSFDRSLYNNFGCHGLALDPTVNYMANLTDGVIFLKAGVNSPKKDSNWVSYSVPSLRRWLGNRNLFALKMDCEGCEYSLADDIITEDIHFFRHVYQFNLEIHVPRILQTRSTASKKQQTSLSSTTSPLKRNGTQRVTNRDSNRDKVGGDFMSVGEPNRSRTRGIATNKGHNYSRRHLREYNREMTQSRNDSNRGSSRSKGGPKKPSPKTNMKSASEAMNAKDRDGNADSNDSRSMIKLNLSLNRTSAAGELSLPSDEIETSIYALGRLLHLIYQSGMQLQGSDTGKCSTPHEATGCHPLLADMGFPGCLKNGSISGGGCRSFLFAHPAHILRGNFSRPQSDPPVGSAA